MVFVFSVMFVSTIVLLIVLYSMFPLDKTQVFFLTSQPQNNVAYNIIPFKPDNKNIEIYKIGLIKEYIKSRNEIVTNSSLMKSKWSNSENSLVFNLSTNEVYKKFTNTKMWKEYMSSIPDFVLSCSVEFQSIYPRTDNKYLVDFIYYCKYINGQTTAKNYKIIVGLYIDNQVSWEQHSQNPLGIRISDYIVESGGYDPLDFK